MKSSSDIKAGWRINKKHPLVSGLALHTILFAGFISKLRCAAYSAPGYNKRNQQPSTQYGTAGKKVPATGFCVGCHVQSIVCGRVSQFTNAEGQLHPQYNKALIIVLYECYPTEPLS